MISRQIIPFAFRNDKFDKKGIRKYYARFIIDNNNRKRFRIVLKNIATLGPETLKRRSIHSIYTLHFKV